MTSHRNSAFSSCASIWLVLTSWSGWAAAEVTLIAANTSKAILTQEQASALYLGKNSSLPDGTPVALFDLPEADPKRDEFYLKLTGKTAAQAKANWAKLSFTGRGTPPKEAGSSDEMKRLVAATQGGIGYLDSRSLDDKVRQVYVIK